MLKYKLILLLATLFVAERALSQPGNIVSGYVRDEISGETLAGATISAPVLSMGTTSDQNGFFRLVVTSSDSIMLVCSYVGYQSRSLKISSKTATLPLDIRMKPEGELEEVIIATTRTNSRIEDLPVKVEVLGLEELEEEVSLVPGGMGSLLGDLSVITIQRTGPISGNDAVRMQGLAPGYTQILQDGLPLYGGFSGSFGVLNIPPLDLRQVEIVKGSSSTLYGGGAIGGLINFLSKKPGNTPQKTLLFNQTSLGETDFNAFFSKKTRETDGFTLLVAGNLKPARDINADGFAEIAHTRQAMMHPHYFWGMGKKTSGDIGVVVSRNMLGAGDYEAVKNGAASADHPFLQKEIAGRATLNGQVSHQFNQNTTWTLRGAGSVFGRSGTYAGLSFDGRQLNSYLETNIFFQKPADNWIVGTNLTSERFQLQNATPAVAFGNTISHTLGVFLQNNHSFSSKWALQTGLRYDKNTQNDHLLPRASLLYKPSANLSARLGYGRGYKTPDLFAATEPADFRKLQALSSAVRPDLANSLNADINYQKLLFEAIKLQVNQALFFVKLARPFELVTDSTGRISLQNIGGSGRVLGTDTYVQLKYKELELYIGYNHTRSERLLSDDSRLNEPFNPQDKIAFTAAWSIDRWRLGVETAFTGNQYVDDNRRAPSYWFWAAMVARRFNWGTLVLNGENIGDARQSRQEALVTGGFRNPVFSPVWGAIEGRVVNLSLKIDW